MARDAITVEGSLCRDLRASLRREWLEADGRGGYASGTVAGAATRRYHALLCVATRPPVARMVLVNGLVETLLVDAATHSLDTHLYAGETEPVVHPEGHRLLDGFRLDPWPIWTWRIGDLTVEKELLVANEPGEPAVTIVRWRVAGAPDTSTVKLLVRPLCSGRDHHAVHHENSTVSTAVDMVPPGRVLMAPYQGVPKFVLLHDGDYRHAHDWYRRFHYPVERERGLESEEDLWSPGEITFPLSATRGATLLLCSPRDDERAPPFAAAEGIMQRERARRAARVPAAVAEAVERGEGHAVTTAILCRAADAFLVDAGPRATVIAGYPWFTDWGRDTFLSLPGLCLARDDEAGRARARALLQSFARHVDGGMIPNRFPDGDTPVEYNTVDASLWYCVAAGQLLARAPEGERRALAEELLVPVRAIVAGYRSGARYAIRVDGDGLVTAGVGTRDVQLTWMDAKVGDQVLTPRRGKPIEIQALWVRALEAAAALARTVGDGAFADDLLVAARRARAAIAGFWEERVGHLADVIDVDGAARRDASLRPNQLYALALDPPVLDGKRARSALAAVERALLTPVGLRTLAPSDSAYLGRLVGPQADRDAAYHQGTVWPHLLGIYADAVRVVRGERVERRLVAAIAPHLRDAGLGQVGEIFDGDEPHSPRGCFAQAWAVAELLRLALAT